MIFIFILFGFLFGGSLSCDCNDQVQRLKLQQKFCFLPFVLHLDILKATESTEGHVLDHYVDYQIKVHRIFRNTKSNDTEASDLTKMKSFIASSLCGVRLSPGEYVLSGGLNKNGVVEVNHCEMIERIDGRHKKKGSELLATDCSKVDDPKLDFEKHESKKNHNRL